MVHNWSISISRDGTLKVVPSQTYDGARRLCEALVILLAL
jgi:hypothetical protein